MVCEGIKMVIVPARGTECICPSWMKADNFQDFLLLSEYSEKESLIKKIFVLCAGSSAEKR